MEKTPSLVPEYFSFHRDLDNLFVESGRQAHVIWRLDGSFGGLRAVSKEIVNPPGGGTEGIWAEPLRLADFVHFHVWDAENGLAAVERNAKKYSRYVGWSEILYEFGSHPWLRVRKTVWVPLKKPAIVVELTLVNQSDTERRLRLFTDFQSRLSIGWPLREGGRNTAAWDPALGIVAHDETHPEWTAICGTSAEASAWHLGTFQQHMLAGGALPAREGGTREPAAGRSCLQHELTVAADSEITVTVVVCGSPASEQAARAVYQEVMGRHAAVREEKAAHYRRLFSDTVTFESPSYVMNKAFLWAKIGTEDFKHDDPRLGFLFFAGYPAYNFYFASDSMLIMRGSLCFGDFEDVREMMRTIVRYQAVTKGRDTLPGEIWHEMSTSGDRISPNFAGFLFPGLVRYAFDWTGDRAFLDEMYPHARAVIDWGFLMDVNGDGLLENGPEGEMADSASEDRNVERSHYHVQTQWLDALREGIGLAAIMGDAESARRWEAARDRLLPYVNGFYWNEERRYFEETIRPDGSLDTSGKGLPNMDTGMVDEGKAAVTSRLLLEEEAYLTDAEAFRKRQEFEQTFSTHRGYMSWYVLERGRRALQLFRAHRSEPACRALEEVAGTPFHWTTPGLWPEVWAVDEPSALRVRGCFHQAWTGSHGYIYPLVDGLLGVRPDAAHHAVALEPHLPARWPSLHVKKLRIGDSWIDVACEQRDGWRRLCVRNHGAAPLGVTLSFALPAGVRLRGITVNGEVGDPSGLEAHCTPVDTHVSVTASAAPGGEASAELRWEESEVALDVGGAGTETATRTPDEPFVFSRTRPGSSVTLVIDARNRSHGKVGARLAVDLPRGWTMQSAPRRLALGAGVQKRETAVVVVPRDAAEGYYTVRVRLLGDPSLKLERTVFVPVFRSLAVSLDARQVTKAGRAFPVHVPSVNLAASAVSARAHVDWPAGWSSPAAKDAAIECAPGSGSSATFAGVPAAAGDAEVAVQVTSPSTGETWSLHHPVHVIGADTPLVIYSGFLACPLASDDAQEVVNLPANYALRKPHVFDELLSQADLVLTSDQHDAVFSERQIEALIGFVEKGGSLVLYCGWSAPWGRGFFDTFGNVAGSRLPDILPLRMRKGITHARKVRLLGDGARTFAAVPWDTIPAYDHNAAELRPGARLLAESEAGAPLVAAGRHGKGSVCAIAIDCFGYESYVEGLSFDFWPGKRALIRAAVASLLEGRA